MNAELIKEKKKSNEKPRDRWVVVMYNDDTTTMDFVVAVLIEVFNKSFEDAINLMLQIHKSTKQVVGFYPEKLANAKCDKAITLARAYGFNDFTVKVEKV